MCLASWCCQSCFCAERISCPWTVQNIMGWIQVGDWPYRDCGLASMGSLQMTDCAPQSPKETATWTSSSIVLCWKVQNNYSCVLDSRAVSHFSSTTIIIFIEGGKNYSDVQNYIWRRHEYLFAMATTFLVLTLHSLGTLSVGILILLKCPHHNLPFFANKLDIMCCECTAILKVNHSGYWLFHCIE